LRCLFVADLHYSLPIFDWLLQAEAKFDVVALAGDALVVGSIVDYRAQTLVVCKYLERIAEKTRLIICSGNHDLDSRSASGEKAARWMAELRAQNIAGDGNSLIVGDTLFTICPWWDGPVTRAALEAQLAADSRRRRGLSWVWIHHAPPANSPTSWSGSRTLGDDDLARWIAAYSPDIVVAGHIHQSPFVRDGSWADRIGATLSSTPATSSVRCPPISHSMRRPAKRSGSPPWMCRRSGLTRRLPRPIPSAKAPPVWFDAPRGFTSRPDRDPIPAETPPTAGE
jgi:Icc-related predicted phosphoesterase